MQEESVWNFGPIEVEIHMERSDIRRRLPCELDNFLYFNNSRF